MADILEHFPDQSSRSIGETSSSDQNGADVAENGEAPARKRRKLGEPSADSTHHFVSFLLQGLRVLVSSGTCTRSSIATELADVVDRTLSVLEPTLMQLFLDHPSSDSMDVADPQSSELYAVLHQFPSWLAA